MTPEQYELLAANGVLRFAQSQASYYAPKDAPFNNVHTASVAILIRALELATPELSPERRASLFTQGE
jgi:hypothetical protein